MSKAKTEPGLNVPDHLLYTKDHEWARVEDEFVVVGITDFAQNSLGDITYVELPDEGASMKQGQSFGSVDSLKTVSELYSPLTGEVVEVNASLPNSAEKINEDPYGDGWMIKIEMSNDKELEGLMPAADYLKLISKKKAVKK